MSEQISIVILTPVATESIQKWNYIVHVYILIIGNFIKQSKKKKTYI